MKYRQLGTSELNVPVVMFGGWAIGGLWWGGADDENALAAIREALELGINCIDTAPAYGFGHSEKLIAEAVKGRRTEVIIATKCGLRWDLEEGDLFFEATDNTGKHVKVYRNLRHASVLEECNRSLKRLKTDYIDLYQCHWPDPSTGLDETLDALLELQKAGKVRAVGVSNFSPEMMETCRERVALASDQPRYSLLSRDTEKEVLPYCRSRNVGLIAYSPLEHGLLTGKFSADQELRHGEGRAQQPWFRMENRRRALTAINTVRPIAQELGMTVAQLAINWIISQPGVTSAIVGARNPRQVQENARTAEFTMSHQQLAFIRREFETLAEPT
ncbi:MAG: aldo/keto reductase [Bacteroidota bacterium]